MIPMGKIGRASAPAVSAGLGATTTTTLGGPPAAQRAYSGGTGSDSRMTWGGYPSGGGSGSGPTQQTVQQSTHSPANVSAQIAHPPSRPPMGWEGPKGWFQDMVNRGRNERAAKINEIMAGAPQGADMNLYRRYANSVGGTYSDKRTFEEWNKDRIAAEEYSRRRAAENASGKTTTTVLGGSATPVSAAGASIPAVPRSAQQGYGGGYNGVGGFGAGSPMDIDGLTRMLMASRFGSLGG